MDPLTLGVAAGGIAVVGGIVQAYNSAKARGANKDEMKRIRAIWDAIVPPQFDVSPDDPPKFIEEKLQGAKLDFSRLTPEQFKVVGQYSPEGAAFIAEQNPKLVEGNAASKEGRQAQIDALRQFQQISKGEDPRLKAGLQDAAMGSQAEAQSRTQSLLQDAQRRGGMNSGLGFASMLQGNSDAMNMGAANSRAAVIEAYKQKLAATQMSGDMGRQLANDELSQEQVNAGIINDFNQRTSKAYQSYLQQQAELRNQAQLYNLQSQQSTADKNTQLNNETDRWNLQNQNSLAQQAFGNERDERNYQNTLAAQKAAWAASEKARQNNLKQTAFGNQSQIAAGKSGIGFNQMQMNNSDAADKNAVVSGVTQAGLGALMAGYQADRDDARWEALGKFQSTKKG